LHAQPGSWVQVVAHEMQELPHAQLAVQIRQQFDVLLSQLRKQTPNSSTSNLAIH